MERQAIDHYKQKVLSLLLKKYERSLSFQTGTPSKQRPQMTIAGSELAKDYEDEMDYRKREWIHAALYELSHAGIIEVTWPKHKENIEVHKVYLNFEAIGEAYQLSGLTPKGDKIGELGQILAPLATHPWEWVRSWYQETDAKLRDRKSAGLDLDDLAGYRDLVRVLLVLPELEDSIPKRVFSQNLFHDSKHFEEQVERRLASLLRRIYPEELEKDEDYLDQVGIVDNPKLTLVAGPLVVNLGSKPSPVSEDGDRVFRTGSAPGLFPGTINLSLFSGGFGISVETIKNLYIQDIPARTILLIENLTTYHEVIRELQREAPHEVGREAIQGLDQETVKDVTATAIQEVAQGPENLPFPLLVLYTGGFPHKSTQTLLRKIADFLAETEHRSNSKAHNVHTKGATVEGIYHWGDIDYGGIRIFEYLKKNFFPSLKPYRMDVRTYLKYLSSGLAFREDQAGKLERLLADPAYTEWYPLIKLLLQHRKRVEQESMSLKIHPLHRKRNLKRVQ